MNKDFYVYVWLDTRKRKSCSFGGGELSFQYTPFYIGKGRKSRAFNVTKRDFGKNILLISLLQKIIRPKVEIIKTNLTEKNAIREEKRVIHLIGRRDLQNGPLANMTNGGDGLSGHIPSVETRKKISASGKGRIVSEETRRKISSAQIGKIIPLSLRKKMSKSHKGKPSNMKGKHHTEETKQKIRDSRKNQTFSIKTRDKISKARKGHSVLTETRNKISLANCNRKKLTKTQIKKILLFKGKISSGKTAEKFSVSATSIKKIWRGEMCNEKNNICSYRTT